MSDLGALAHCMVDSDGDTRRRNRKRRRAAVVIAALIEAALVLAMLIWPLITPALLPRVYVVTPLPPYSAPANSAPSRPHVSARPRSARVSPYDFSLRPHPTRVRPASTADDSNAPPVDIPGAIPGGTGSRDLRSIVPGGSGSGPAPPPPSRPSRPVRVSRGVMEASLIHRIQPVYPTIARAMGLSGEVRLHAVIGEDGNIKQIDLVSGNPILARAAIEAVRQWRYKPTLLDGEPVEVETYITVTFTLE